MPFVDEIIEPHITSEGYESERINAIYMTSIFIALVVWYRVLGSTADIGVLAGLIGVSGVYLFLLKSISVLAETLFNREISIEPAFTMQGSISREFFISLALFFGSYLTLFCWGLFESPFPSISLILHFFIAYFVGVIIKIGLIKISAVPIVAIIITTMCLVFLGILMRFV